MHGNFVIKAWEASQSAAFRVAASASGGLQLSTAKEKRENWHVLLFLLQPIVYNRQSSANFWKRIKCSKVPL